MKLLSFALDHSMEARLGLFFDNRVLDVFRVGLWLKKEGVNIDLIELPTSIELLLSNWDISIKLLEKIEANLNTIPLDAISIEGKPVSFLLNEVHVFPPVPQPKTFRVFSSLTSVKKRNYDFYYTNPTSLIGHNENLRKPNYVKNLSLNIEMVCFISNASDTSKIAGYSYVLNWFDARHKSSSKAFDFATSFAPFLYIGKEENISITISNNQNLLAQVSVSSHQQLFFEMISFAGEYLTLNPGDVFSTGSIESIKGLNIKIGDVITCESKLFGNMSIQVDSQDPPTSIFDAELEDDYAHLS